MKTKPCHWGLSVNQENIYKPVHRRSFYGLENENKREKAIEKGLDFKKETITGWKQTKGSFRNKKY